MPHLSPELPPEVAAALRRHFGFDALRPGQAEALAPVVAGRDALVVMPTGAGKSLVFQLAAMLRPGVTVVVSPLIALMKDQVDGLVARGLPAATVHSGMSEAEQRGVLDAAASGGVRLLYVAPERLRTRGLLRALDAAGVGLLAVDEAHCVSQWGHDFRPDYLGLADARRRMGDPQVVALTATATPRVQDDIAGALGLREPARIVTGFNRPNLRFSVRNAAGKREKMNALLELAGNLTAGAGLVYAGTRKDTEALATQLAERTGREVGAYHAGLPDAERSDVQERFISGRLDLVVATNAFGMGVDRPDVRFVAHWALPSNLVAYYPEAGRAGRDDAPAEAVLLYAHQDIKLRERFIARDAPDTEALRKLHRVALDGAEADGVLRADPDELAAAAGLDGGGRVPVALLERAGVLRRLDDEGPFRVWRVGSWDDARTDSGLAAADRLRAHKTGELARLVDYAQTTNCRRRTILDHFGDDEPADVEPARCCDACATRARIRPAPAARPAFDELPAESRIALGLLDAVRRQPWPVGRRTLARVLIGSKAAGMDRYERNPYFGRLAHLGETAVDDYYRQLLMSGYLRVAGGDRPVVELTEIGEQAVRDREAVPLAAPTKGARAPRLTPGAAPAPLSAADEALFERLRAWRADRALMQSLPAYVVFDDRALRELAAARPRSEEDLLAVRGVGPAKLERYGAAVLAIVNGAEAE